MQTYEDIMADDGIMNLAIIIWVVKNTIAKKTLVRKNNLR